ncbi:hypothetical protein QBC44DRAFT_287378 [Cladorrhinum sp. PSN332]|nr:hypothetical protein QBC44DRAFT_287378 [Cladorrhinum sp. PSN332]
MEGSLPTPPNEDILSKNNASKRHHSASKTVKTVHRASKRASPHGHAQPPSPTSHDSHSQHGDNRHKRVWKACERCRMKKTKCDGEFPCKRCKDDGLVCTAGLRKKTEYKQLPRGYAEVLENTQFALIATVHKLYAMVRNNQPWDLGEPELNEKGQPVIHNIAARLGCIRPHGDVDLPVQSFFPEDEAGLVELARSLEEQQTAKAIRAMQEEEANRANRNVSPSSSDLDHSDLEQDYRKAAFGGGANSAVTMSPASLNYSDFDSMQAAAAAAAAAGLPPDYGWVNRPTTAMDYATPAGPFIAGGSYLNMDMLNQGLIESNFGTIKPHVLSCPNPEVMLGMGDPMMYSGYDAETLRM